MKAACNGFIFLCGRYFTVWQDEIRYFCYSYRNKLNFIEKRYMSNDEPPLILVKTWLALINSNEHKEVKAVDNDFFDAEEV